MKTGTSWIHEFLSWHHQVSVPTTVKETYFFSRNYYKGQYWFSKQFGRSDDFLVRGEVGPTYFPNANAATLIRKHSPKAQIIIILRDPYERFLSHYLHHVRAGSIEHGVPLNEVYRDHARIRGHSEYYKNIVLWKQNFTDDQVTVLHYEDLSVRPQRFIAGLSEALGIKACAVPDQLHKKVGDRRVPLNESVLRVAIKLKRYLRQRDMHVLVNTSKRLGIPGMLYSKREPPVANIDGAQEMFSIFLEESTRLEEELGIDVSQWQSSWQFSGLKP